MWGLFFLKEETNKDYSFPAGLEDHILGENVSPNTSISGLVPSELTQSNTSLGSSSSSGDVGKLQCPTGMGKSVLRVFFFFFFCFCLFVVLKIESGPLHTGQQFYHSTILEFSFNFNAYNPSSPHIHSILILYI